MSVLAPVVTLVLTWAVLAWVCGITVARAIVLMEDEDDRDEHTVPLDRW